MAIRLGARIAAALVMGAALSGAAWAHEDMGKVPNTPAGKAVAARHENFKQQGRAFKAILDELKKDTPDKTLIATNAQKMKALAADLPKWFPRGSGPESGAKTDAKPEIWKDPNGFSAAATRLQLETSKLDQFAAAGDLEAVKTQVKATGGTCKNCHDKFRVPEKH
ncbi:MAG: cytochrome [Phenylobacterium sp.]|nr:cytochrome [Phenylobacterium sp.]